MKRYVKRLLSLVVAFSIVGANAQITPADDPPALSFENYYSVDADHNFVWNPIVQYEAKSKFYAELRYNYEDLNTLTFFAGRTFEFGDKVATTIKPILGFSIGEFTGASFGVNLDIESDRFYISSQTQVSAGARKNVNDFFYTWSEAGIYIVKERFYVGYVIQQTREKPGNETDQGFIIAAEFKSKTKSQRLSIPLYFFRPFSNTASYMIGINLQLHVGKK